MEREVGNAAECIVHARAALASPQDCVHIHRIVFLASHALLALLCLLGVGTLLSLHCYFIATHQTTYEWLIARQRRLVERPHARMTRAHLPSWFASRPPQRWAAAPAITLSFSCHHLSRSHHHLSRSRGALGMSDSLPGATRRSRRVGSSGAR